MFAYPKQAEVNRVVPKTKIYTHARPSKRIKKLFVDQVEEIVWKYKLSPETINLPARNGISEIQVFEIVLKTLELDDAVLQCINKAVSFPLLFQLTHSEHLRFAACYKRPSNADSSQWVIEASFQTGPQPVNTKSLTLPVALDLCSLYEQIIRRHMPLLAQAGESIRDHVSRINAIQAKEKEREQLGVRLGKEKQFNRKVELNAALRSVTRELKILKHI